MKKVLLFLLLFFLNLGNIFASNLEVRSNLESGEYNFPIEINLISNDKEAKIFYYTDGEGRIDNIKEFKKPILLKQDTTIDFYATTKDYEDTLIKTSIFTFKYTTKLDITGKDDKIIIKNNSGDIQNIGYWIIEADNLNYEITPNTFLEANDTFKLDYKLTNNEKITLTSPDKKIVKDFIYKEKIKKEEVKEIEKVIENEIIEKKTETGEIKNPPVLSDIPLIKGELKGHSLKEIKEIQINNSLKTSIIESSTPNKNKKNNNLYIILGIFFIFIMYNIGLLIIKNKNPPVINDIPLIKGELKEDKNKFIKK